MESNYNSPDIAQDVQSEQSNTSYDKSQDSIRSLQIFMSRICDEENNKKKLINKKIMCEKCNYFPKVYLNDDRYSINVICDCKEYNKMETDYFMKHFVVEKEKDNFKNFSKKIIFDNYCYCDKHLGKKYAYFCVDCEDNLCNECFTEIDSHSKHEIINFKGNKIINKMKEIKEIKEKKDTEEIKEIKEKLKSAENCKKFENFLEIISVILEVYENYPCYSGYICINNIYDFLTKNEFNDIQVIKHEGKMEEYYKVKLEKDLKQLLEINKKGDALKTIRINKKNFYCLDILSNLNFKSLIQLELSDNNIEDLTPLLKSKFPVLNILNLSTNKIDDENANKIFQFFMPNLSYLNLYQNNLTKFDFFKNIHTFKKLKKLFIGLNQFNFLEMFIINILIILIKNIIIPLLSKIMNLFA